MDLLEQQLHYPLGETLPEAGRSIEVLPGVRWVRMPLPFALNHINLWLLRDEIDGREGWTIVDCCISHKESRALWEQIFANELQGLPVLRVIVTHMHPDHIGLSHWLCQRWNAPLWISATDYFMARTLCSPDDSTASAAGAAGGNVAADFFLKHGLTTPDVIAKIRARTNYYTNLVPSVPDEFMRMLDGDVIRIGGRNWRCISGYGHAPEHMALYCPELNALIGGDMMLPRISTNVSVHADEPEANPLRLFLDSIARFRTLPVDALGLPSHGKPFTGIHRRIEQLEEHHRDRLADLMTACAIRPQSAAETMPILFKRPLDVHQTTFAMGETVAHLHLLWFGGQLRRTRGDDGIYRFGLADAAT